MVEVNIGRHGVVLLVLLFLLMGFEDVLIWVNTGTVPAAEFFLGMLVVLAALAVAVLEARWHPPPLQ